MARAIELLLDHQSERRVRRLWQSLEESGVRSLHGHTHRRHRPHVTYLVCDDLDPAAATQALRPLLAANAAIPLSINLVSVGVFPGEVLFLAVAPSAELLRRQAAVYEMVSPRAQRPWAHYTPGDWAPHCTLSMRVPPAALPVAVPLCLDALPIHAVAEGAAVVDTSSGRLWTLPGVL